MINTKIIKRIEINGLALALLVLPYECMKQKKKKKTTTLPCSQH